MVYAVTPHGDVVHFVHAIFFKRFPDHSELYDREEGNFIAQVPASWAISVHKPVSMSSRPLWTSPDTVIPLIEQLRPMDIAHVKQWLKQFDARTGVRKK